MGSLSERRVGVLGGTFDPIHNGHVAMIEHARRCAGLDEVLVVPVGVPPHRGPADASAADRLQMCRLALEGQAGVEVLDVEVRREGPSYMLDTLDAIGRLRPGAELDLILGWDAARLIRSWHRYTDVLGRARLVIVARPGLPQPAPADLAEAGIDAARASICPEGTPEVNATELRRRATDGEPLTGMVPPAVESYIRSHGLYQGR